MNKEQIDRIVKLRHAAARLESEAKVVKHLAQDICEHKRVDGTWAVVCPLMCNEPFCSICGIDDCDIPGYKPL